MQQTVEDALRVMFRLPERPHLTVAGRTDAGVHARGQVAHADVPEDAWAAVRDSAVRRLSGLLPPDVRVLAATPAYPGFDARFSALSRRYVYRVCDNPVGVDPMRRHEVLWHPRPLDVDRMNAASALLLGEHDFAAFCRRRTGASTVRALLRLDWVRPSPGLAVATVVADAFCHNMVRSLVGALLKVGDGLRPAAWPAQVLAGRTRDPAVTVLPPHGLCLEEVAYPPPGELSARAFATRAVRGPVRASWPSQTSPPDAARPYGVVG